MSDLPQQTTITQYVADGVTTDYDVAFFVPTIDDVVSLDVYVTPSGDSPIPANDIQTYGSAYTYAANGDPITGGTVTFLTGFIPGNGDVVTLVRNVPAALDVEFSNAQNFSGVNLDNALQTLLLIEQQNKTYAFERNISYIVNSYLDESTLTANTQIPVLQPGEIWQGSADGVVALNLEENPDVSTLRAELASELPDTNGATIVGFYDEINLNQTTVADQLTLLGSNQRLFGTDTGAVNAMILNIPNTVTPYVTGMEVQIIPAFTNTSAPTINLNGNGAVAVKRDATYTSQPGDLIVGKLAILVFNGTYFIHQNVSSIPSGSSIDFMGGTVPPGFLLEDGTAISRTTYAALFAAIGITWGAGDGSNTFNLANSQRRNKVGSGGSATSPEFSGTTTGSVGGEEVHIQTLAELAAHSHNIIGSQQALPGGGSAHVVYQVDPLGDNNSGTITAGSSTAFNLMQLGEVVTMMTKI